jgi:hypothetical protein
VETWSSISGNDCVGLIEPMERQTQRGAEMENGKKVILAADKNPKVREGLA